MISQELLDMLVCPESKQPLAHAPEPMLEQLNQRIAAAKLVNRAGVAVEQPIEAGLVREDGQFLYLVRDDIPVMLADESIPLAQLSDEPSA